MQAVGMDEGGVRLVIHDALGETEVTRGQESPEYPSSCCQATGPPRISGFKAEGRLKEASLGRLPSGVLQHRSKFAEWMSDESGTAGQIDMEIRIAVRMFGHPLGECLGSDFLRGA